MYANRQNSRIISEIWVQEHDRDVRFYTGSGNIAVSRMRSENAQYNPYDILQVQFGHCVPLLWDRYYVPQNVFISSSQLNSPITGICLYYTQKYGCLCDSSNRILVTCYPAIFLHTFSIHQHTLKARRRAVPCVISRCVALRRRIPCEHSLSQANLERPSHSGRRIHDFDTSSVRCRLSHLMLPIPERLTVMLLKFFVFNCNTQS